MSDYIGRVPVPTISSSGLTFPLVSNFGYGRTREWVVVSHRYGSGATLQSQRYFVGSGARRFQFAKKVLSITDRKTLVNFYNATQGGFQSFVYEAPNDDRITTTAYTVVFDTPPLSIEDLANRCQTGITFCEIVNPASAPTYSVNSTCVRFPSNTLATALLSETQQIIPLIHIKVVDPAVPDIYLSDRRVTIGSQLYLPRVLSLGEPGTDTILSQDLKGSADSVKFVFGNADRVMTALKNDTSLKYASIDLSFFHVNTGILLKFWKGVIQSFTSDGTSNFPVTCSDGLYPITQSYPRRTVTRSCFKTFNDGIKCPWASAHTSLGAGQEHVYSVSNASWSGGVATLTIGSHVYAAGDTVNITLISPIGYNLQNANLSAVGSTTISFGLGVNPGAFASGGTVVMACDYTFNGTDGCLAHGMSPYFGAHPAQQQNVVIKDDGTGVIFGFGRNTVTSTSIVSDSIWDTPLAEIWCNDGGSPLNAFYANCPVVAVRNESTFMDVLGIVGVGPIGGYEGASIQTTSDGYRFLVSPLADGFPPQGITIGSINNQLVITGYQPTLGLIEVIGNDPVHVQSGRVNISSTGLVTWVSGANFSLLSAGQQISLNGGTSTVLNVIDSTHLQLQVITGLINTVIGNILFTITPVNNVPWAQIDGFFSLGQGGGQNIVDLITPEHWDIPDPVFGNILTGAVFDILPFAAGTAFVELRYATSPGTGIAPTTAEAHTMQVPLSKGLTGYTFDNLGNRTAVPGLVNPFWIAVNSYFRALGIDGGTAAQQLASFILPSLYVGDGSGTAEIADAVVPVVVGTGTEVQFTFNGAITDFKPFRDWLTQILACALGYYTFEFGALKLGIRENASAVTSFTVGNMLYQSLSLQPAGADFEYLRVDFANVALQYQLDMAEYQDKDHAAYFGRSGAPLSSRMHSLGISTLSQASRVAVTRVREETGGILRPDQTNQYIEWDNNDIVTFKTTLLALDCEVGQVIEITHPDCPTYPGPVGGSPSPANTWKYRIQKISYHKDWSITIQAKSVVDSMYDLDVGPKPADVPTYPLPVLFYATPLQEWLPYQVQADGGDALYPGEWTFDLPQSYPVATSGQPMSTLTVTGKLPVNQFLVNCGAPDVKVGNITQSSTGGTIPGGSVYYVQICAQDSTGRYSPPSDILLIQVPTGTNTNQFSINDIRWPSVDGLATWVLFGGLEDDIICGQLNGSLIGSASSGYTPTTLTVLDPFVRSTYSIPYPNTALVRAKGKRLVHGGVEGLAVTAVPTTNTIVCAGAIDTTGADNWTGRVLAVIGRSTGSAPFAHFNITAFNPATGAFTLDRDPSVVDAGVAYTPVQLGDAVVVCFLGYDNSANPYYIGDAGLSNATDGHTGETPNDPNRIGNVLLVIKGTSRGLKATINSNTVTGYGLSSPLFIDSTSVYVVLAPNWDSNATTDTAVTNGSSSASTNIAMSVSNYNDLPMLIEAITVDQNGNESGEEDALVRMTWIYGARGTTAI